jgi:hypothetical protein
VRYNRGPDDWLRPRSFGRRGERNRSIVRRCRGACPEREGSGQHILGAINLQSATAYGAEDTTDNISGTGEDTDRWDIFGSAKDFDSYGRTSPIPCYGVTGSKFGVSLCTIVPNVTALPQACITAAQSLPTNPAVVAANLAAYPGTGMGMLAART